MLPAIFTSFSSYITPTDPRARRCIRLVSDPDILKQLLLCALNVVCLAGKCFAVIPLPITNGAYVARCLYPFLDFASFFNQCAKDVADMHAIYQARCYSVLPWTAVSLFIHTSAFFLAIGSCIAACSLTASYTAFAGRCFAVLVPWGKTAFLVGLFRDVLSLLPDQQTLEVFSQGTVPPPTSAAYLYFRSRIDAYSLREWEKCDPVKRAEKACDMLQAVSFHRVLESVQAVAFYPANWLIKCYPNSRLEASIYIAFSLHVLWLKVRTSLRLIGS